MKKLLILLLSALSMIAYAQTEIKRVAILETVDKAGDVNYGVKTLLRQSITFAITRTAGYEGYNRVDMAQIMGEHNFQRTGYVSDEQIKKLGQMTGAAFVLIAEAANYDPTHIVILANLVNVESGRIVNSSIPIVAPTAPEGMSKSCADLAKMLLSINDNSHSTTTPTNYQSDNSSYSYTPQLTTNQDFTETAWGVNMKMIWVEGGDFLMGCTSDQGNGKTDEQNVRRVTVDGFFIGMLEVTQSQWETVAGTSIYQQKSKAGSNTYGIGPDYPMYCVSWDEAMEFCRMLSNKTGRTYTLPTEAQWEYAARGGNKNEGAKYAGSNMIDAVAWYDSNSANTAHIVGSKRANALGIYDMSGNVWEWCKDWYADSYVSYDTNNPVGPSSGSSRVCRGGSWYSIDSNCRVASRNYYSPNYLNGALGFRVVCLP